MENNTEKIQKIKVAETPFESIQGEGKYIGVPMLFIRLSDCNRRCYFCLVKGTQISTSKGYKNIEGLKIGDEVLSYDFSKKEVIKDRIKQVFERELDSLIRIKLNRKDSRFGKIFVSPEHLFYTTKRGWVKAINLKEGEEVFEIKKNIRMSIDNAVFRIRDRKLWKERISNSLTGLTRSKEQRKRYSIAKLKNPTRLFGKDNPNWRGGITNKKFTHNWKEWYKLRKKVIERDNKKCLICGSEKDIVVHHIDFDESNNVLENLCVLCRKCNSSINHGRYEFKSDLSNGVRVVSVSIINRNSNRKSYVRLAGRLRNKIKVFNIETENNNYFANRILVHNCDTKYSWEEGIEMEIEELVEKIKESDLKYICWTGGEPLLQRKEIKKVINRTREFYHYVEHYVETNGDLLKKEDFNLFHYLAISPKVIETAKKVRKLCFNFPLDLWDIKVVTDLEKVGVDMLKFATSLMPLSTGNKKIDKEIQQKVWEYCVKKNIKYSPRLQVKVWGLKTRGV